MANTKSAKKNVRLNEARRQKNLARKTAIKTAIKKVQTGIVSGSDENTLKQLLADVASKLGRARGKRVMHKKTAARKLSRLAKRVSAKTHGA